jgi:gamma-F420-2:alpha-L-glutamate ligase
MGIIGRSGKHLSKVGESYLQHMRFAGAVGSLMVIAGGACIIHALVPALFEDKASRTIRLLHRVIEDRAAADTAFVSDSEADGLLTLMALALLAAAMPWLLGAEALVAAPMSLLSLAFPVAAFYAAGEATGAQEAGEPAAS